MISGHVLELLYTRLIGLLYIYVYVFLCLPGRNRPNTLPASLPAGLVASLEGIQTPPTVYIHPAHPSTISSDHPDTAAAPVPEDNTQTFEINNE